MRKIQILALAALVSVVLVSSVQAVDQEQKRSRSEVATERSQYEGPIRGKVNAFNKTGKMITVGKRKFSITDQTKVVKGDDKKPASLDDVKVGEVVGGYWKTAESGASNVTILHILPPPAKKK